MSLSSLALAVQSQIPDLISDAKFIMVVGFTAGSAYAGVRMGLNGMRGTLKEAVRRLDIIDKRSSRNERDIAVLSAVCGFNHKTEAHDAEHEG